jgi:hypothetical protein
LKFFPKKQNGIKNRAAIFYPVKDLCAAAGGKKEKGMRQACPKE